MINFNLLPANLPKPQDDGQANHLVGLHLPNIELPSTNGEIINVSLLKNWVVLYCYPMTGQPDVPLPKGWDEISGARGCTPQSCSYRDHYQELKQLNAEVFGISTQPTDYQREMVGRLHLPFNVLSDNLRFFQTALNLPTFEVQNMILLKRLTLIAHHGVIKKVHYPVFPSNTDAQWVIEFLTSTK